MATYAPHADPLVMRFKDYPMFCPNLSPRDIFELGSFGGTYWRDIYSGVNRRNYKNQHTEFKSSLRGIPLDRLTSRTCDITVNKYRVRAGSSLKEWEDKQWISSVDPYGWVQWYCRFCDGRRVAGEDERQIKRWARFAGPEGRFRKWLITLILKSGSTWDDPKISPKIRQTLQHWAYRLTAEDFEAEYRSRSKR